jgi:hypothetical protein
MNLCLWCSGDEQDSVPSGIAIKRYYNTIPSFHYKNTQKPRAEIWPNVACSFLVDDASKGNTISLKMGLVIIT